MPYLKQEINKKILFWCLIFGHSFRYYKTEKVPIEEVLRKNSTREFDHTDSGFGYNYLVKCINCGKMRRLFSVEEEK